MNINIHINYQWSCDQQQTIPQAHKDALREDAEAHIFKMIQEGYSSGELNTIVRFGKDIVPDEDENEGLTYTGWWTRTGGYNVT